MPRDCLSLLARSNDGTEFDWRETVEVEHCDRIKRLLRVSAYLPESERPIFFEANVLAERLPGYIGVRLPILRVVFPERVFFDTDSIELKPAAVEVARIVAESLRREPPDVVMFVAGHADARASREYNARLSIDRANALAERILDEGTALASVWRVGFGEDLPLVAGDDEYAYGQNRRIEFLFAAKPEAIAAWLVTQPQEACQGRTEAETRRCREHLVLNRVYEATDVTRPAQTSVRVARDPVRTADATRGGTRKGGADRPGGVEAGVSRGKTRAVDPAAGAGRMIDLHRPTTFKLDLRSQQTNPIYGQ